MAEQGQLTSDVVIQALRGQSDAVAAEFTKLPPTVGRALQNLSTQWTLYVGAADNGMVSSRNAAVIIDGLAKNLDVLVGTLTAAGKGFAAFKIAGLAGDAIKWAAATLSATQATTAATAAVVANTAATGANTAAKAANAAATASAGTAVAGTAVQVAKAGLVWRGFTALFGPLGFAVAALAPELVGMGKALDGQDLAKFEVLASNAFIGTSREAERMAQVMDASVRAAVQRTGLDFDVLQGKIGAASRSAINDVEAIVQGLDKLKKEGVDTGRVLSTSLTNAIDTADSQKALDVVTQQIKGLRKELGDNVTNGLLDQATQKAQELKDALDKATPGINSMREAMQELGLKSRDELSATAKKAEQAFDIIKRKGQEEGESYVAWQSRKGDAARVMIERAIAANGGFADANIQARAAVEGLDLATDSAGKTIVKAFESGAKAATNYGRAVESAADKAVTALERQNAAIERANAATEKAADLERKRLGVDKEGFSTDKNGQRLVMGSDTSTLTGIFNFLKAAGVDDELRAKQIAKEFADSRGEVAYINNPGQMKYGGAGSTMSQALLKAAEQYTFSDAKMGVGAKQKTTPSTDSTPTAPGSNKTVTIVIGGQSQVINVAGSDDQTALTSVLRQLATAARTATGPKY